MDTTASEATGYPIVITHLSRALCVVIGGGAVARRRVAGLVAGGAEPLVVSPDLERTLREWCDEGRLRHRPRRYRHGDLEGAFLAVAATSDPRVNRQVVAEAEARGVLVNAATSPAEGHFQIPASARRGRLLVSVSTGGSNPSLAAHLRDELSGDWAERYARLAEIAGPLRAELRRLDEGQRRRFWREIADPERLEALSSVPLEVARARALERILTLQGPPGRPGAAPDARRPSGPG